MGEIDANYPSRELYEALKQHASERGVHPTPIQTAVLAQGVDPARIEIRFSPTADELVFCDRGSSKRTSSCGWLWRIPTREAAWARLQHEPIAVIKDLGDCAYTTDGRLLVCTEVSRKRLLGGVERRVVARDASDGREHHSLTLCDANAPDVVARLCDRGRLLAVHEGHEISLVRGEKFVGKIRIGAAKRSPGSRELWFATEHCFSLFDGYRVRTWRIDSGAQVGELDSRDVQIVHESGAIVGERWGGYSLGPGGWESWNWRWASMTGRQLEWLREYTVPLGFGPDTVLFGATSPDPAPSLGVAEIEISTGRLVRLRWSSCQWNKADAVRIATSPDGTLAAVLGKDGCLRLVDLEPYAYLLSEFEQLRSPLTSLSTAQQVSMENARIFGRPLPPPPPRPAMPKCLDVTHEVRRFNKQLTLGPDGYQAIAAGVEELGAYQVTLPVDAAAPEVFGTRGLETYVWASADRRFLRLSQGGTDACEVVYWRETISHALSLLGSCERNDRSFALIAGLPHPGWSALAELPHGLRTMVGALVPQSISTDGRWIVMSDGTVIDRWLGDAFETGRQVAGDRIRWTEEAGGVVSGFVGMSPAGSSWELYEVKLSERAVTWTRNESGASSDAKPLASSSGRYVLWRTAWRDQIVQELRSGSECGKIPASRGLAWANQDDVIATMSSGRFVFVHSLDGRNVEKYPVHERAELVGWGARDELFIREVTSGDSGTPCRLVEPRLRYLALLASKAQSFCSDLGKGDLVASARTLGESSRHKFTPSATRTVDLGLRSLPEAAAFLERISCLCAISEALWTARQSDEFDAALKRLAGYESYVDCAPELAQALGALAAHQGNLSALKQRVERARFALRLLAAVAADDATGYKAVLEEARQRGIVVVNGPLAEVATERAVFVWSRHLDTALDSGEAKAIAEAIARSRSCELLDGRVVDLRVETWPAYPRVESALERASAATRAALGRGEFAVAEAELRPFGTLRELRPYWLGVRLDAASRAEPFDAGTFRAAFDDYAQAFFTADAAGRSVATIDALVAQARVYQRFGTGITRLEEPLRIWLANHSRKEEVAGCSALAARLAEVGAFGLEKAVLETLAGAFLATPEQLERLKVLAGGRQSPAPLSPTSAPGVTLDVGPVAWRDEDLAAFFDSLAKKREALTRGLALGQWQKSVPAQIEALQPSAVAGVLSRALAAAFGDMVILEEVTASLLTSRGARAKPAALIRPSGVAPFDFRDVAVLVLVDLIGRSVTLHVYTALLPVDGGGASGDSGRIEELRRLAISVKREDDPDVRSFLQGVRDGAIQAIEAWLQEAGSGRFYG